jgi:subtilase family serine protease
VTVSIPRNTVPSGTYYLLACANDTGTAAESNEKNNCMASTSTVQITGPDLLVTVAPDPPANVVIGGSFSVTDTVQNQGDAVAGASATRYYLSLNSTRDSADKSLTGTRSVPALAAGADSSGTITVTIPTTTAAGTYYLLACADGGGAVAETNETNNCRASSTTTIIQ